LFAEGNEELQQAFVRVQASLALLQGTEQALQLLRKENAAGQAILIAAQKAYAIATGVATAATRSFSAALAATGVGALVVALGLLVSKFMEASAATKQSNLDLEEAAKKQKQLGDEIALTNKLRQSEIDLAAAAGATAKATALENIKLLKDNINEKQKEIDAEQKLIDKIEENKSKVIDAQKGIFDALINQTEQKKNLLQVEFNDLSSKLKQQEGVVKEYDENVLKSKTDNSLKARQQVITDLEAEMNYRKQIGEDVFALEENILREKLRYAELTKTGVIQAQAELRLFLMQGSIEAARIAKEEGDAQVLAAQEAAQQLDEIVNQQRLNKLTEFQREQEEFLTQRAIMLELMRTAGASELELQLFQINTAKLAEDAASENRIKRAEDEAARIKAAKKQQTDDVLNITKSGISSLNDLIQSAAGKSEAQQRRAFEINKKANIAMALIDTYLGASQVFVATKGGPIIRAIATAAAIVAGLARVNAIRRTQFQSPSPQSLPSGGGGVPSGGGGQQPNIPTTFNPNVTSTAGFNPGQGQQQGQQPPVRAYVVDRDIENASSRRNMLKDFAAI
jgi:hypothetical protein